MSDDYRDLLIRRSERGTVRGADQVLEAARHTDYLRASGPHAHRRSAIAVAALVVVAAGVAGALALHGWGRSKPVHPAGTTEMCIVFAHPEVSADAFSHLEATVRTNPEVQDLIVFDKDQAFDEATRLLPQAQSAGLTADSMQPSVRFRLRDRDQADSIVTWSRSLPNVQAVSCGVPVDEHGYRINPASAGSAAIPVGPNVVAPTTVVDP